MNQTYTLAVFSNNKKKLLELTDAFKDLPITVCSYQSLLPQIEVVEDGDTFEKNAQKKVDALPPLNNVIYIADDSGLEIDALNNEPGVLSARYAGPNATDTDLCQKVLTNLHNINNRSAQFRCVIALKLPNQPIHLKSGTVKGSISQTPTGQTGFGYDPIFIPENHTQTFAELGQKTKQSISHRAIAIQKIKPLLLNYLTLHTNQA